MIFCQCACFSTRQYFDTLFSSRFSASEQQSLALELPAHLAASVPALIHFLYRGTATVPDHALLPLLVLADRFALNALARVVATQLMRFVSPATAATWLHVADALPAAGDVLRAPCMRMVLDAAGTTLPRGALNAYPAALLCEVLSSDQLRVPTEMNAVRIALDWLTACPAMRLPPMPAEPVPMAAPEATETDSAGPTSQPSQSSHSSQPSQPSQHDAQASRQRDEILATLRFAHVRPSEWFRLTTHAAWSSLAHAPLCAAILEQASLPQLPARRAHYTGALQLRHVGPNTQ